MKIAISGVTGLIGSTLKDYFLKTGHQVSEISRHRMGFNKSSKIYFNPKKNYIDVDALEGHDVIIHLAGANISGKRWSVAYKREILESRVIGAKLIADAVLKMNKRPKIFFCASAVGYYGNHEPEVPLNEHSSCGKGFLAQVCERWENASAEVMLHGVRLVHMRFGVVLNKKGGALAKMLPLFYFGLGGCLGSGRQKMSWITLDEIPNIIEFIMAHNDVNGPVNFVSPNPVTNKEFTKILGHLIHRPTIFPVPGFMIKLIFGQMGKELLLDGAHVNPQVLLQTGYQYKYPQLKEALQSAL
jgi:uncharacterized protein (TIGR01777 family)